MSLIFKTLFDTVLGFNVNMYLSSFVSALMHTLKHIKFFEHFITISPHLNVSDINLYGYSSRCIQFVFYLKVVFFCYIYQFYSLH